jgi:hypothetical protein
MKIGEKKRGYKMKINDELRFKVKMVVASILAIILVFIVGALVYDEYTWITSNSQFTEELELQSKGEITLEISEKEDGYFIFKDNGFSAKPISQRVDKEEYVKYKVGDEYTFVVDSFYLFAELEMISNELMEKKVLDNQGLFKNKTKYFFKTKSFDGIVRVLEVKEEDYNKYAIGDTNCMPKKENSLDENSIFSQRVSKK